MEQKCSSQEIQQHSVLCQGGQSLRFNIPRTVRCSASLGVVDLFVVDSQDRQHGWNCHHDCHDKDRAIAKPIAHVCNQKCREYIARGVECLIPSKLFVEGFRADNAQRDGCYAWPQERRRPSNEKLREYTERLLEYPISRNAPHTS